MPNFVENLCDIAFIVMNEKTINISISKEQVSKFPTATYPGYITVVDDYDTAKESLRYLNTKSVVGIDTETKPSFRKGTPNKVSLIQIASESQAFLFRINKIGFIEELRQFLGNGDIKKVGLSLKDDFRALRRIDDFEPASIVELQSYVKKFNISDNSLQKIFAIIFGERISKGQRLSNWEAEVLTTGQQNYAALDAWACLKLYNHLESGAFNPQKSPFVTFADENTILNS